MKVRYKESEEIASIRKSASRLTVAVQLIPRPTTRPESWASTSLARTHTTSRPRYEVLAADAQAGREGRDVSDGLSRGGLCVVGLAGAERNGVVLIQRAGFIPR